MAKTGEDIVENGVDQKKDQLNWKKELLSWIMIFVVAIGAAFLINRFVIVNATVPTGSMENTIMPGDRIIGLRFAYINSDPKRGDIVIFKFPDDESQNFVKRVIGLPGEHIRIEDGKIYINGKQLDDTYAKEAWDYTADEEFVVPADSYFMMGDNRNNSEDSRFWNNKYVKKNKILGKAVFRYWPFGSFGKLK